MTQKARRVGTSAQEEQFSHRPTLVFQQFIHDSMICIDENTGEVVVIKPDGGVMMGREYENFLDSPADEA